MVHSQRQPAFPVFSTAAIISLVAGGLYLVSRGLVNNFFGSSGPVGLAVGIMALVVWVGAVLALAPVATLARRGLRRLITGYFVGMGLRVVLSLAGAYVCIAYLNLPPGPVALTLVAMYLPLLFVETGCIGRYLWPLGSTGIAHRPESTA